MEQYSRCARWTVTVVVGLAMSLGATACDTGGDEAAVSELEGDVAGTVGTPPTPAERTAPAVSGEGGVAEDSAAAHTARLEVDVSERKLYAYHEGERMSTYSIAVGEPDHPTPKGDFEIDRIIWNPAWVPPPTAEWAEDNEPQDPNAEENPMVGAKLFFKYPDYYVHGTDATHTLGEAESHGCIRMAPAEVKRLAEWVQEHAGADRGEQWYDRVKDDDETKHEISLPDPVPIVIQA